MLNEVELPCAYRVSESPIKARTYSFTMLRHVIQQRSRGFQYVQTIAFRRESLSLRRHVSFRIGSVQGSWAWPLHRLAADFPRVEAGPRLGTVQSCEGSLWFAVKDP